MYVCPGLLRRIHWLPDVFFVVNLDKLTLPMDSSVNIVVGPMDSSQQTDVIFVFRPILNELFFVQSRKSHFWTEYFIVRSIRSKKTNTSFRFGYRIFSKYIVSLRFVVRKSLFAFACKYPLEMIDFDYTLFCLYIFCLFLCFS